MSEQRETWAVTCDDMGEPMAHHVSRHLEGEYHETLFRPVRIPPPAEIEANARDAECWRKLESMQWSNDLAKSAIRAVENTMKGGE